MDENGWKFLHFDTQPNRFNFFQFEKMTGSKIEDFSDPFSFSSKMSQSPWQLQPPRPGPIGTESGATLSLCPFSGGIN